MNNNYLVIEGNIGSGKTSLARIISEKYNRKLILEEFAENTFLPQFYQDPDRYAFPLELSFLAERYGQLKKLFDDSLNAGPPVVSDYLFEKSFIFAGITLKKEEMDLYNRFYEIIRSSLPQPGLVIYLHKSVPNLQKNIMLRGRPYEKEIPDDYLTRLEKGYMHFFSGKDKPEVRIINTDEIDFVHHPAHLQELLAQIFISP